MLLSTTVFLFRIDPSDVDVLYLPIASVREQFRLFPFLFIQRASLCTYTLSYCAPSSQCPPLSYSHTCLLPREQHVVWVHAQVNESNISGPGWSNEIQRASAPLKAPGSSTLPLHPHLLPNPRLQMRRHGRDLVASGGHRTADLVSVHVHCAHLSVSMPCFTHSPLLSPELVQAEEER